MDQSEEKKFGEKNEEKQQDDTSVSSEAKMPVKHAAKTKHVKKHVKEVSKKFSKTDHPVRRKHKDDEKIRVTKSTIWMIISLIFLALFVASLLTKGFGSTGSGMSDAQVQAKVLAAVENVQPGLNPSVSNIIRLPDGTYKFDLTIQGQQLTSYLSSDGSLFFPQAFDVPTGASAGTAADPSAANAAVKDYGLDKTDKPTVELFVMTHCPYGTQAEKGILPVVDLLGQKMNFKIKFVDYAMH